VQRQLRTPIVEQVIRTKSQSLSYVLGILNSFVKEVKREHVERTFLYLQTVDFLLCSILYFIRIFSNMCYRCYYALLFIILYSFFIQYCLWTNASHVCFKKNFSMLFRVQTKSNYTANMYKLFYKMRNASRCFLKDNLIEAQL